MKIHHLLKYCASLLLLLFIGMYACKSKEKIIQADSALEHKANSKLFEDIMYKGLKFNTFSSKLSMTISTGTKTVSSKGNLRIINNEAILLSVQPLFGIEMFRLYVEPDHLIVLDRMNKRYVKETFDDLTEKNSIGFNFYSLQSLFTNNLFVPEQSSISASDYRKFKYSETSEQYVLSASDKKSNIDYSFSINGNDQITLTQLALPKKNYSLHWNYSQFSLMRDLFFPHEMMVVASTQKNKLNASFSLSDINLETQMDLETTIPSSYTKMELSEVLKMFSDKK
ncbi:MAG TPA: DUF4292 domain-containing protein [Dysgonamonadaceae bacterium]|nr:DUF4292 domain-containing protein [Dysgonamonadaceae bacterium]